MCAISAADTLGEVLADFPKPFSAFCGPFAVPNPRRVRACSARVFNVVDLERLSSAWSRLYHGGPGHRGCDPTSPRAGQEACSEVVLDLGIVAARRRAFALISGKVCPLSPLGTDSVTLLKVARAVWRPCHSKRFTGLSGHGPAPPIRGRRRIFVQVAVRAWPARLGTRAPRGHLPL